MKVGIVTSYAAKQPAGLERFLLDLLAVLDISSGFEYVVYVKKGTGLAGILKENNILNINVIEVGFGKLWKDIGLFFAPRADAYIFNGPLVPFCFTPKNYFVILYDFAYKYIKPHTRREKLKARMIDLLTHQAIKRAKKIITVSNTTKNEVMKLFGAKAEQAVTIYSGFRRVCATEEDLVFGVVQPYFFYVGTLKERKNVVSIIRAFSQYKKERQDNFTLVIVGKKNPENSYIRKLLDLAKQSEVEGSVFFTGHISDAQLSFVYRHATALVFPSLIEGFGFPVLEAMSCGVPVITSNRGSLAEVSGDAAVLVDPLNIAEITAAMKRIADDKNFKAKLVADGLKRAGVFNWSKTVQELEELIVSNIGVI